MNLKRQINSSKIKKISDKSLSQPSCRHSNTIYDAQLQKTIVLRMQPRRQATVMQPLQCVWQHHVANSHVATHMATEHDNNSCSHSTAICNHRFQNTVLNMYNYACTRHIQSSFRTHRYGPGTKKHRNERTATAAHTSCLSSPAAATLHRKKPGFVLRLPPQHNPMQHPCSHYNAFCRITWLTPHVSTHMATDHGSKLQPAI